MNYFLVLFEIKQLDIVPVIMIMYLLANDVISYLYLYFIASYLCDKLFPVAPSYDYFFSSTRQ